MYILIIHTHTHTHTIFLYVFSCCVAQHPLPCSIGHADDWDDIIIDGNPDEFKFVAHYVKGPKVLAVSSMGADPAVSKAAELMYQGKMYSADEIRCGGGVRHDG